MRKKERYEKVINWFQEMYLWPKQNYITMIPFELLIAVIPFCTMYRQAGQYDHSGIVPRLSYPGSIGGK